ncbi:Carrier protein, mitochondrial [Cryptotrichosporon argae]
MPPLPDLLDPLLPDGAELVPPRSHTSARPDEPEWPEAGPSAPRHKVGPLGAKAAAAMTGAMATSLLMTPFDVLKTRLQTGQPHLRPEYLPPPPDCCQTTIFARASPSPSSLTCLTSAAQAPEALAAATMRSTSSTDLSRAAASRIPPAPVSLNPLQQALDKVAAGPAPPRGCYHPSRWAGIWGEAMTFEEALARGVIEPGGALSLAGAPQGRVAARVPGFWVEIGNVWRETGVRGLWKGVGTTLTMSIPSAAIYMLGYEHLLSLISPYFTGSSDPALNASSLNRTALPPPPAQLPSSAPSTSLPPVPVATGPVLTPAPLIAGALARTLSATTISPLEMFRTRLQALPGPGAPAPTYASTGAELVRLVRAEGPAVLWRGLGPTLWRDVPFSALYWAGFEILKAHLHAPGSPLARISDSPPPAVAVSFLAGAVSGTAAALATQPFDVLKTRRQVFTPAAGCDPAALRHKASTLPLALHVVRSEGWRALFAGTAPRCGKVAPACGLMIACYEGVGRWLSE